MRQQGGGAPAPRVLVAGRGMTSRAGRHKAHPGLFRARQICFRQVGGELTAAERFGGQAVTRVPGMLCLLDPQADDSLRPLLEPPLSEKEQKKYDLIIYNDWIIRNFDEPQDLSLAMIL